MKPNAELSKDVVTVLQNISILGADAIYQIQLDRAWRWNRLYPHEVTSYPHQGPLLKFILNAEKLQLSPNKAAFHSGMGQSRHCPDCGLSGLASYRETWHCNQCGKTGPIDHRAMAEVGGWVRRRFGKPNLDCLDSIAINHDWAPIVSWRIGI